jgi:hypothetical protein
MPNVLTTHSTVRCGHGPGLVLVQSQAKLAVGGGPVLLRASIADQTVMVSGCKPPTTNDKPCLHVSEVSAGISAKLKVDGQPVILETLKGSTDGTVGGTTPQRLLSGVANQGRLSSLEGGG